MEQPKPEVNPESLVDPELFPLPSIEERFCAIHTSFNGVSLYLLDRTIAPNQVRMGIYPRIQDELHYLSRLIPKPQKNQDLYNLFSHLKKKVSFAHEETRNALKMFSTDVQAVISGFDNLLGEDKREDTPFSKIENPMTRKRHNYLAKRRQIVFGDYLDLQEAVDIYLKESKGLIHEFSRNSSFQKRRMRGLECFIDSATRTANHRVKLLGFELMRNLFGIPFSEII